MCRHAATNVCAGTCPYPHGYLLSFISWPKPMTTECPKSRTLSA